MNRPYSLSKPFITCVGESPFLFASSLIAFFCSFHLAFSCFFNSSSRFFLAFSCCFHFSFPNFALSSFLCLISFAFLALPCTHCVRSPLSGSSFGGCPGGGQ